MYRSNVLLRYIVIFLSKYKFFSFYLKGSMIYFKRIIIFSQTIDSIINGGQNDEY